MAEIDTTEIVFFEQALEMLRLKEEQINIEWDKPKVVEEKTKEVPIVYEKQEINQNKLDWFDVDEEGAACDVHEDVQTKMEELSLSVDSYYDSDLNPEAPLFKVDVMQQKEYPLTESAPQESEQPTEVNITEIDKLNQEKYFYFYQCMLAL